MSNELSGTLSRIDPARNVVVDTVDDRQPAAGSRPRGGSALRRRARLRRRPPRRHADAAHLERRPAIPRPTPRPGPSPTRRRTGRWSRSRTTGSRASAGWAAAPARGSCPISPSRFRPPPTAAARTPSGCARGIRYSTGRLVRPEDFRRAIERALLSDGTRLVARRHRRGLHLQQEDEAVRSRAGDRDRPGLEHRHLPPASARPRLPVQARAPSRLRGACRNAAPSPWLRACDRPVPDRLVRSRSGAYGSSATRGFASGRPRRSLEVSPTRSSSA